MFVWDKHKRQIFCGSISLSNSKKSSIASIAKQFNFAQFLFYTRLWQFRNIEIDEPFIQMVFRSFLFNFGAPEKCAHSLFCFWNWIISDEWRAFLISLICAVCQSSFDSMADFERLHQMRKSQANDRWWKNAHTQNGCVRWQLSSALPFSCSSHFVRATYATVRNTKRWMRVLRSRQMFEKSKRISHETLNQIYLGAKINNNKWYTMDWKWK